MSSGWNTIESDAGVFTELIEKLGVKGLQFSELLSIDPDSLAAVQPLYGLIFLFKYRQSEVEARLDRQQQAVDGGSTAAPDDGSYDEVSATLSAAEYPDQAVFFAHQKIQNACATQAVLSLLLNLNTEQASNGSGVNVDLGPTISNFGEFADAFDPGLRGETISNSEDMRAVHNSFSKPNPFIDDRDQDPRDRDENSDGLYHFISYIPVNGQLYELDGLHAYPISHGECTGETFASKVSEVLQRRVARSPAGEMRFALLALTADQRQVLASIGDTAGVAAEEARRDEWRRENVLRRQNFFGLVAALAASVSRETGSEEKWHETVIQPGRDATKRRIAAARARREF